MKKKELILTIVGTAAGAAFMHSLIGEIEANAKSEQHNKFACATRPEYMKADVDGDGTSESIVRLGNNLYACFNQRKTLGEHNREKMVDGFEPSILHAAQEKIDSLRNTYLR